MKGKVLFVCTGNYYRSRFAEILFNHLAEKEKLAWKAVSCGTEVYKYQNEGPLSVHTRQALEELQIPYPNPCRYPVQVGEWHLEEADVIIALKRIEHQPPLSRDFPEYEKKAMYWDIHDLDVYEPAEALGLIRSRVEELIKELAEQNSINLNGKVIEGSDATRRK